MADLHFSLGRRCPPLVRARAGELAPWPRLLASRLGYEDTTLGFSPSLLEFGQARAAPWRPASSVLSLDAHSVPSNSCAVPCSGSMAAPNSLRALASNSTAHLPTCHGHRALLPDFCSPRALISLFASAHNSPSSMAGSLLAGDAPAPAQSLLCALCFLCARARRLCSGRPRNFLNSLVVVDACLRAARRVRPLFLLRPNPCARFAFCALATARSSAGATLPRQVPCAAALHLRPGSAAPRPARALRPRHLRPGSAAPRPARTLVFVADRRLAHRLLVQGGATFADRPPPVDPSSLFTAGGRDVSSSPYGAYWRLVRRNLALCALFSWSHARQGSTPVKGRLVRRGT